MSDSIPTIVVTPKTAADAYARIDSGAPGGAGAVGGAGDFGATLLRALQDAVDVGHSAESSAMAAINGSGNLTEVVTALNRAELTLQATTAIRDRVVQAYQDILKMPI